MSTVDIVFIVGIGRSGTSLLQNMLNAHSDVCFLPENSFLRRYVASGKYDKRLQRVGVRVFSEELAADEAFGRLRLSPDRLADILESEDGGSGERFFSQAMREFVRGDGSYKFIGDKDPRLIEFLPMLHVNFPNARIIHIYRDPRDVALSKTKAKWSRDRSFLANLFAGRVQWTLVSRSGSVLFGPRFHEVSYEELIAAPQDVLTRLCSFLGLEFDVRMLSPGMGGRDLVADDEMSWKRKSLGPILADNTGKWRTGLSPVQIALAEAVTGKMMADLGYKVSLAASSLNVFQRSGVFLRTLVVSMAEPAYCWYRIWKQSKQRR